MEHASVEPRDLSFHLLEEITNGFSEERKLGSGAYGKVYKGVHKNGQNIAVKVLYDMPRHEDNEEQFQKEFNNLVRLQHQNIVQLVGYCNEIQKQYRNYNGRDIFAERMRRALCFEFMDNGSLDNYLSDESSGHDWPTRYAIIKGICQGLKYLHEELRSPIYHLDLKPANILLDRHMVPKIADFGLSRIFGQEQTQVTNTSMGTLGYVPPEYIDSRLISIKFDIFSLGVVIIKILTGHEGFFRSSEMSREQFTERVHGKWMNRLKATSVDALESYCEQVKRCIEIALSCVEFDRHKRPTIGYIIHELNKTEIITPSRDALRSDVPSWLTKEEERHSSPGRGLIPLSFASQVRGNPSSVRYSREKSLTTVLSTLPKELPLDFLKNITDQFSEDRILSKGVFGTIYRGIIPDGETIAVKRLAENLPVPQQKAFTNELQNLTAVQHQNIVRLVGFCHEGQKSILESSGRYIVSDIAESLLCYEYLPRGNLQRNLFDICPKMDWDTRFNIIKGICKGIHFMHNIHIVHMDVKPETIFLDANFVPKITNFGLSRLFGQEQTRLNTQTVVGSYGYMAPEYIYRGEISTKSDIYSLGMLIIETTTGEKNFRDHEPSGRKFIEYVRTNWRDQRIASEYPTLNADCLQEVKKCIKIGLECVDIDRMNRPSIEIILEELNGRHPN